MKFSCSILHYLQRLYLWWFFTITSTTNKIQNTYYNVVEVQISEISQNLSARLDTTRVKLSNIIWVNTPFDVPVYSSAYLRWSLDGYRLCFCWTILYWNHLRNTCWIKGNASEKSVVGQNVKTGTKTSSLKLTWKCFIFCQNNTDDRLFVSRC